MKSVFRSAIAFSLRSCNPRSHRSFSQYVAVFPPKPSPFTSPKPSPFTSKAGGECIPDAPLSPTLHVLEKQFEEFRHQLDDSDSLRERLRSVAFEIENAATDMKYNLLSIRRSRPIPELAKAKEQISVLRELYNKLAEIIRACPGHYYRYHGDWRSETQTVVSMLAFMHFLETESLLLRTEVEEKLGLNPSDLGLDIEDYLIGICFMSSDLPMYVLNQVIAGDYDCPRKVLEFLIDLCGAFGMLNPSNDFWRKKFDGVEYDLRRVEELFYNVKLRGLTKLKWEQGDEKNHEL